MSAIQDTEGLAILHELAHSISPELRGELVEFLHEYLSLILTGWSHNELYNLGKLFRETDKEKMQGGLIPPKCSLTKRLPELSSVLSSKPSPNP